MWSLYQLSFLQSRIRYAFDSLSLEAFGLRLKIPLPGSVGGWTEVSECGDIRILGSDA